MTDQAVKPAVLNDDELKKLRALEAKMGDDVVLVAYARPLEPAGLTDDQLGQIKKLEQDLGRVYVVAWKKPEMVCE